MPTPLNDFPGKICPLPSIPIEKIPPPSREDFERLYLTYPGKPVIIQGAMERWPAMSKWSFDFFRGLAGDKQVLVRDNLFTPTIIRKVSLRDFLFYCESPGLSSLGRMEAKRPFYSDFKPFQTYTQLLDDFEQPPFFANVYESLTGPLREWFLRQFSYLFVGPKGTLTKLHSDLFETHAWLGQVCGRKHVLMYSPEDAPFVYGGEPDLVTPDLERWPLLAKGTLYEGVVEPGEMVIFPAGWFHHVVSLDPSISISFNGVNETNYLAHIMSISKSLPRWARMVQTPSFREGSGLDWEFEDLKPWPEESRARVKAQLGS